MKIRRWGHLLGVLLFCFAVCGGVVLAREVQSLTFWQALQQAFENNLEYTLFLRERELDQRREALAQHPAIDFLAKPVEIKDGEWQNPQGSLNLTLALAPGLDLSGALSLSGGQGGWKIEPRANLTLTYDFFQRKQPAEPELVGERLLLQRENALVIQTLDLLVQLRRSLDELSWQQGRYELLHLTAAAVEQIPSYDDLQLRRNMREQAVKLAELQEQVDQLRLELSSLLGAEELGNCDPVLEFALGEITLDQELLALEWSLAHDSWAKAQTELQRAESDLFQEEKTKGWQLKASGSITSEPGWELGLIASKRLYPRVIVLEELHLKLEGARRNESVQRQKMQMELRRELQALQARRADLELKAEHFQAAQGEWELRRRQLQAGLVTELALEEARLELLKAEFELSHSELALLQSIFGLFGSCGRDLKELAREIAR